MVSEGHEEEEEEMVLTFNGVGMAGHWQRESNSHRRAQARSVAWGDRAPAAAACSVLSSSSFSLARAIAETD